MNPRASVIQSTHDGEVQRIDVVQLSGILIPEDGSISEVNVTQESPFINYHHPVVLMTCTRTASKISYPLSPITLAIDVLKKVNIYRSVVLQQINQN